LFEEKQVVVDRVLSIFIWPETDNPRHSYQQEPVAGRPQQPQCANVRDRNACWYLPAP